jgi:hypothetical protein
MTHYAVLRHGFDVHRNPDRLGPLDDESRFCLNLGVGGGPPSWLVGNAVWLISWQGFMKTHHVVTGWFLAERVERRAGVVAQHAVCGNDGELFARGVGPLDMHAWFHKLVESDRRFREGEPTEVDAFADDLTALARNAGFRVPVLSAPAPQA